MFIPFILLGQNLTFSDGPYIFIKKDRLVEKSLINGKVITKDLEINKYLPIKKREIIIHKSCQIYIYTKENRVVYSCRSKHMFSVFCVKKYIQKKIYAIIDYSRYNGYYVIK